MLWRSKRVRSAPVIAALILIGVSASARPSGKPDAPKSAATSSKPKKPRRAPAEPPAASSAPAPSASAATASPRGAPAIDTAIRKLEQQVRQWGGTVGVSLIEVDSGAPIAALEAHAPFNPASNAKLATAAAALHDLGPQHRFLTGLYGKPNGDGIDELALRGDGDPSLTTRDLWALAQSLRAAGIRRVKSIAVDQSRFDDRFVPPAFEQQPDEWAPFRAPVAPVSINENTVLFGFRAARDGSPALIEVDPPGFVDLTGAVVTTKRGDPEKITLGLEPKGARLVAKLGGSLPEGSRVVRVAKRVDDPRLLAGYVLRAVLKDLGVDVAGEVRLGGEAQKQLLASHRSPPVGELVRALGKESDNFYAEMLFKAVGANAKGLPASSDAGAAAVEAFLRTTSAFEPGMVVKNGSGLFDANRVTPGAMTTLLRAALRDPAIGPDFVAHLAIGGVDGTLRARFRGLAAERAIRAKTGTLEAVAALSGYILAPPGRSPIAFSVLVNGIAGKVGAARPAIDEVIKAAAAELWSGAPKAGGAIAASAP